MPGSKLGRYTIKQKLGAGGVGVVYRATDPSLDRDVAIKLVRTAGDAATSQARLVREARALARLSHPNVVQLFDVGTYDEAAGFGDVGVFIVMELIDGVTLREHIDARRPSWRRTVTLLIEAGRGLEAAHARGLIHRDFKPGNVVVDNQGRVRVLDFGLARGAAEFVPTVKSGDEIDAPLEANLTATGVLIGTPAYMPPEQLDGDKVDERADQFAFCVTLWEMLFGVRPFRSATAPGLSMTIRRGPPDPPDRTEVPTTITAPLRRGLAADPDERFESLSELLNQLKTAARRRAWKLPAIVGVAIAGALTTSALWPSGPPARGEVTTPAPALPEATAFEARVVEAADGDGPGLEIAATARLEALLKEARRNEDPVQIAAVGAALSRKFLIARRNKAAGALAEEAVELAEGNGRNDLAFEALLVTGGAAWALSRPDKTDRVLGQARAMLELWPDNKIRAGRVSVFEALVAARSSGIDSSNRFANEAIRLFTEGGADGRAIANAYRIIGGNLNAASRPDQGLVACTKAVEAAEAQNPVHPGVGRSLLCVAAAYRGVGRVGEAWDANMRAVGIFTVAAEWMPLAGVYSQMGLIAAQEGRENEGLALHRHAIQLLDLAVEAEPDFVAAVLNNMAASMGDMGQHEAALLSFAKALTVLESSYGPDEPQVVRVRANYGLALHAVGQFGQAEQELTRALPGLRKTAVPDEVLLKLIELALERKDGAAAWGWAEQLLHDEKVATRPERHAIVRLGIARAARANDALPRARKLEAAQDASRALEAADDDADPLLRRNPRRWLDTRRGDL